MNKDIPNIAFNPKDDKNIGIDILTIESLALRKDEADHNPEKAHQVTFNMFVFYTAGNSKQLVDFVWHPVEKNSIIHLAKGQINAFHFTPGLQGYILLFTDAYLKKQINLLPKNEIERLFNSHLFAPKMVVPSHSNVATYFQLFFDEFHQDTANYNTENTYHALLSIIFSKLEQLKQYQTYHLKQSNKLTRFLDFKALLEKHYTQSRNADFYAEKLHLSYKHLNSICKEIVTLTAKQFIDEFIILEAKRLLVNSDIKSSELAYNIGFEEPTNFVKYFKKHTGVTPNYFKKEYQ